ncbi:GPP34 family phosphoprotein [Microbispora sp. RL4-1S]|uniref:GPP34 family phosphoprotein n=1 Tax=Microbispora oryzae TaxID=2806554 RepID=A0A941AMF5_9ACTN|nr:GPP34 family phosphoprotein [Microbispora oryzae]MBP2708357.1 GPP34 family phosphoprotein [Microbispora oryzae]
MSLAEDFLLLALREEDGKPLIGNLQLECGLAGAVLVELAAARRIDVDGEQIVVRDPAPLGTPEEDATLARISEEEPHDLQWWIRSLRSGLYERTLARLIARGVVDEQRRRPLGILPSTRHLTIDPAPARELRRRLSAIFDDAPADPGTVALLAIVKAGTLDRVILPEIDPDTVERRIRELSEGEQVAEAVAKVIKYIQVALVIVVSAAV